MKDIYKRPIAEDVARVIKDPFSVLIPGGKHLHGDTTTIRKTSTGCVNVSITNETKSQQYISCLK